MSNTTIKWGVIGLGKIAHKFVQGLAEVENAELYAVASRSEDKAKAFAAQYNIPKAVAPYSALLDLQEVDIVYISTPHNLHYENTKMCLEAGKAVLCEKPFGVNLKQAQEMSDIARNKNVFLLEGMWTRFLPHIQKTLEIINQPDFGRVKHLKADFSFKAPYNPESRLFNPDLAGGALLDIGIYPVFLAFLILGKPEKINVTTCYAPTGVDEGMHVDFIYPGNVTAQLFFSFAVNSPTQAYLLSDNGSCLQIHKRFYTPTGLTHTTADGNETHIDAVHTGNGYNYEAEAAQLALRNNKKETAKWTLDNSVELMKIMQQIRDKAKIVYPFEKAD